ncbi:MAG TPA: DUF1592 domain-containing protein, partial [Polyangia bacterium]|nr:DUF1592 domain-containing protein [Polyangia bacterium]
LTDAEAAAHFTLFNQARMLGDASDGIAAVLAAMLQSPHFLYRPELGGKLSGGQVTLTPWEVASRLSYFLWGSMPDAALFSAAETNQLGSAQQVGLQVQRMLTDSRARQGTNDFFRQWLGIDQVLNVTKDQAVYPAWNDGLAVAMREEGYRFTQHVVFDADGRLGSLFTSTEGIVNGPLAQLYGVAITGSDWQPVSTAGLNRMGILTQGWFLAGRARPGESSPARRGAFVRERLFCQQVPPPPANVDPAPPPPLPGSTTRERYQQQLVNPACAACHQFFDGFGFAFEHYDGIGAFRAADNGKPIDSTGRIDATDVDGTVADAPDLIKRLSESGQVRDCVATRWYELAVGRQVDEMNDCRVREVTRLFRGGQGNLRELLLLIATDYARRPRLAGEVASPLGAPLISNPNDRRSVQKMVLDLISTQIVQLRQRLSLPDDRLRLDQHLDGVRELEKRLQ